MKLRYRIIGILLLIGIYFGYREDPGEQYVMVYKASNTGEEGEPFPLKLNAVRWNRATARYDLNKHYPEVYLGNAYPTRIFFVPADIESAEKIEAYLESR